VITQNIALYEKRLHEQGDFVRGAIFLLSDKHFPRTLETLIRLSHSINFIKDRKLIYCESKEQHIHFFKEFISCIRSACKEERTSYLFIRILELVKDDFNQNNHGLSILKQLLELNRFLHHDFRIGSRDYNLKDKNTLYDYVCYILDILEKNNIFINYQTPPQKIHIPITYVIDILEDSINRFDEFNFIQEST